MLKINSLHSVQSKDLREVGENCINQFFFPFFKLRYQASLSTEGVLRKSFEILRTKCSSAGVFDHITGVLNTYRS